MSVDRGKMYNYERYTQVKDFSGLVFERNISPTDIDGLLDFGNEIFVFIELKCKGGGMTYGQQLAFTRLVDNMEKAGKEAVLIVASHNTDKNEEIDCKNALVTTRYRKGEWTFPLNTGRTLRNDIDKFLAFICKKNRTRVK